MRHLCHGLTLGHIPDSEFCRCQRFADGVTCHDCGDAICDECRFRCEERGCWPHDRCERCCQLVDDAHLCRTHRLEYLDRQSAKGVEENQNKKEAA